MAYTILVVYGWHAQRTVFSFEQRAKTRHVVNLYFHHLHLCFYFITSIKLTVQVCALLYFMYTYYMMQKIGMAAKENKFLLIYEYFSLFQAAS